MRYVERGICPIATSIMNELFKTAVFPLPVYIRSIS